MITKGGQTILPKKCYYIAHIECFLNSGPYSKLKYYHSNKISLKHIVKQSVIRNEQKK